MTTIEIYERVPYDPRFSRWVYKWDNSAWFFTSKSQYNTTFTSLLNGEAVAENYSHLVDTFVTSTTPQNYKDLLLLVHTYMPELFI